MTEQGEMTREQLVQGVEALAQTFYSGAKWFYWIAGLSLVNAIIALFKGGTSFVIGLNGALLLSVFAGEAHGTAKGILFSICLVIIVVFGIIGHLGVRRQHWALITGFVLYILDTLWVLVMIPFGVDFGLLLNAGFHVWALYGIFQAIKANNALRQLEAFAQQPQQAVRYMNTPPPPYAPIAETTETSNEPPVAQP